MIYMSPINDRTTINRIDNSLNNQEELSFDGQRIAYTVYKDSYSFLYPDQLFFVSDC